MIDIDQIKKNVLALSNRLDSFNIDSIFIEQNNHIERIFYKNDCLHELRSCAKLLVAMAVGIAIEKKMFDLDTLVYPAIKNVVSIQDSNNLDKIKKWKIRNLLTHTTGYEFQMMSERYIQNIDKEHLLDYALNYDIPYDVGERFAYNNVEPFVLSVFFQEKFGIHLGDFIHENIFQKLDIKEYQWDNYGKYCPGCTGLFLKHSDFHKLGELLIHDGIYNGIQVVPKHWIKEMCSLQLETPSAYKPDRVFPKIGIGYYTFISRDGYVFRDGSNGQYIIFNKEENLLITIMASEKDMKNITEIFRSLI